MFHRNDLVNGPDEDLMVIGNFRAVTILNSLDCPYSSGYTSTNPEEIHPTVVRDLQNGYYYPWDIRAMKILPNSGNSSIASNQAGSSSHKRPWSLSIRHSVSLQSNMI